ncbi:MAG: hypothetical protein ACXVPN_15590 [Bacteroidia bacterium]
MLLLKKIPFLLFLCFLSGSVRLVAQSADAKFNPFQHYVLLKHYTEAELQAMASSDTLKYKTVIYYYTQSYIAEPVTCAGCATFDPARFDVFEYERFRKKSSRYSRVWTKYGFKLTLLSIDELKYKLPIHTAIH